MCCYWEDTFFVWWMLWGFFERCDEEAEELLCSYLLLLFVPQIHLSFTELPVVSFNKSISWRQNIVQRMLVNIWKWMHFMCFGKLWWGRGAEMEPTRSLWTSKTSQWTKKATYTELWTQWFYSDWKYLQAAEEVGEPGKFLIGIFLSGRHSGHLCWDGFVSSLWGSKSSRWWVFTEISCGGEKWKQECAVGRRLFAGSR